MKKTAVKSNAMIWHIYRFMERYELKEHADRFKKGPLMFTRSFVGSGQDNDSISFYQQKIALKTKKNYLALRGVFDELLEIAANRSLCYRGYLIDESFCPASTKKISQWIGQDVRNTEKMLKALADVRLIEYIPLPKFNTKLDAVSNAGGRPQPPAKTGDCSPPFNKGKRKRKILSKNRTRKDKQKTKGFETEFEKWKAIAKAKISHKPQGQSQSKSSPNPKSNPTVSEALGGKPLYSKVSDIPLETVFKENIDVQAMSFAAEVYRLLKMPYMPGTLAARQELFNYYHAWLNAIKAKLPEPALMSLWHDSIKSARRIGDRRGRKGGYKKPGAGWRSEFNKNLAIYQGGKASKGSGFD
jgi:hypothetical protein